MFLQYFTLSAALLMVIVQPVKSDSNEWEAALREALHIDVNINILQSIFYPDDGSDFSEADIIIDIFVNYIAYSNNEGVFSCPNEGHSCSLTIQQLHVSTVGSVKSYLKRFMYAIKPADVVFYEILSSITGGFNMYYTFSINLYIQNLTNNPDQFKLQSAMERLCK